MGKADVRARLKTSAVWRYGLPVFSVAAALAATCLLQPYDFRTPLFFLAIMVSTWAGGTGPGLLAVLLSTLFTGQFLSPQGILETRFRNLPNVVAFLLTSLMIGSWYAARRRAEDALEQARDELETKVRERTAGLSRSNEQLQKEVVERRRAEEALRESEERFKAFMDNSPAVAFVKDEEGRFIYINQPFKSFFNVDPDDLVGKTDFDLWPEETAAQLREHDRAVLRSGRTLEAVEMVPAPDGTLRPWLTLKFPLRDKGGRLCLAGMAVNITELRRAEEELRRVSERLQLATRAAGIGIWDWDVVQDKLVWDDATYGLFGVREEDFGGAYDAWAGTLAPEDFERITADVRAALRGERVYDTEFRVVWPDGSVHYLKADGQVFWDEAGRPLRMVGVNYDITERKQAEEVAKAGEERLRLAFEVAGIGTGDLDLETNKISLSHPMQRVLGLAPGTVNLTFEEYVELVHPEDRASVSQSVENAIADRTDIALDYRIVWPEGTVHWVTSRARVFYDETGQARRIIGALTDITERKLAEDEVRRQKEVFQKIFDNAPIALNFFSEDGRLLMVNRAWERIFGWTLKEVEEGNIDIFAEAMTGPRETEWVREFVSAAGGRLADFKIKSKDGRTVDLLGAVVGLSDGTRIGIAQDITDRKRVEAELRESEARFRAVFEGAGIGISMGDMEGRLFATNPALQEMLGYSASELSGVSFTDVTHPDDVQPDWKMFQELAAGKRDSYKLEKRYYRKDGELIYARLTVTSTARDAGKPEFIIGMAENVTESKLAEEQLRRTNEELRALSARLHSVREEESARIAREIHDELGASLSSLKWGLEEIGEDVSESAGTPPLAALREKVAGMITQTDSAVDTVRRIASELRPTALEEFGLAEALCWHSQQFQARTGIEVFCDWPPQSAGLGRERATAVFRICQEALTNVMRHAEATRVDVKMSDEAGHFVLTVSDNGRGITEAEKRASHSLGLLGMRERAHLLGGEITIEGTEGRGTVVTVRVPTTN